MEEKGKWFLLYKMQNTNKVQNFVDNVLPWLHSEYLSEDLLVPGYSSPTCKAGNSNKVIETYADVLREKVDN
eukprot:12655707-Ditylum_brightwellii.AAC.1